MSKNIIKPGDQFAKAGTTPWADWQRSRLKHAIKDVHFEARQIVQVIRDMCAGPKDIRDISLLKRIKKAFVEVACREGVEVGV